MSMQEALIAHARPRILSSRMESLLAHEITKGCRPDIYSCPTELEPLFQPISKQGGEEPTLPHDGVLLEEGSESTPPIRLKIWLHPEEGFEWITPELLIKQLSSSQARFLFEIAGNEETIMVSFLCQQTDLPLLQAALRGQYPDCGVSFVKQNPIASVPVRCWEHAHFFDYYPQPPYSHLLTRPVELQNSPLESLIHQLLVIPKTAIGIYQVVFQPVYRQHDWHRNVEILLDLEYKLTLHQEGFASSRVPQQSPTMDLRTASQDINNKAHNDKPFYAVALRTVFLSETKRDDAYLQALNSTVNVFQHGGKPLHTVTACEYLNRFPPNQIQDMFLYARTYRPGFLLNSLELTGLVHLPVSASFLKKRVTVPIQETLRPKTLDWNHGTLLGHCHSSEGRTRICIPQNIRLRHTHILGRNGVGKSILMEFMAIADIEQNNGIAVFDPHGDLIEGILQRIPKEHTHKVIYFDPGHPERIPVWNPLARIPGQDSVRLADDLVGAFKSIVEGWGDRLERILRNCLLGLLHREQSSLLDVYRLLHRDPQLRKEILQHNLISAESLFWTRDFDTYSKDAFDPPKNKLDKLMASGPISLMLSQNENRIHLRDIMDEGHILLINLSNVGSEARDILGSFILSLFHLTALNRHSIPREARKPFHIYCDEAHRFMAGSIEDIIAETRKYGVSLTLAHQYLSQFPPAKRDALSNVGSTILFNVDSKDAQFARRNLQDRVEVEDIISLGIGQAIARIGTEIARFSTQFTAPPKHHFRERILSQSFQQYYKSHKQVSMECSPCESHHPNRSETKSCSPKAGDEGKEYEFSTL